jgi:two-component system, OmpR family, copper resistance phosphate regulon response regulator CusR
MHLLVAENDPALATFLHDGLEYEHYSVDLAEDGDDAKYWVAQRHYDLAILDLDIERGRGTQVLQYVRTKRTELPILILSSQNRAEECAQLLDLGADDLLLKPFSFSELSARVRALLRRAARSAETVLSLDDLELNRVEHSVKRAGRAIELTPKEFGLLEYLMRNAGKQVTRAQILNHVWNLPNDTLTNVVDVYVNYLRKKINGPSDRKLIHTVRGIGYEMRAVAEWTGPQLVECQE